MSAFSEVSILIGQRAGDLEKAQDVFITETRGFVNNVLTAVRRARSEPWILKRVRIDLPDETESEGKTGVPPSQFARPELKFRKAMKFSKVADVRFGIEYEESLGTFMWQIVLVPDGKYRQMDDLIWNHWQSQVGESLPLGSVHQVKLNLIRFVQRPISDELTWDVAFSDVKQVLETLLLTDDQLAEAVGLDAED